MNIYSIRIIIFVFLGILSAIGIVYGACTDNSIMTVVSGVVFAIFISIVWILYNAF